MEKQLWLACSKGKIEEVINLLQSEQINVNWQDSRCAANQQVFEYLRTPFWIACHNGRTEIVKLLLNDDRVDFNKTDTYGWTPFWVACYEGHIEIVNLLLNDERIEINKTNTNGWTPLYAACCNGNSEIVKLLLNDKRIDINEADVFGETSFQVVCQEEHVKIVKLFLNDERLDVNKVNKNEATPLHYACHFEIVQYILGMGRDVNLNIKNNNGKTAIDIARENQKVEIGEWENEVEFQERKRKYAKIVELLESFERNPNETRTKLRIELGLAGKLLFIYFILFHFISFISFFFKKKNSRQGCCFYFFNDSSVFRFLSGFQKKGIKNPLEIICSRFGDLQSSFIFRITSKSFNFKSPISHWNLLFCSISFTGIYFVCICMLPINSKK